MGRNTRRENSVMRTGEAYTIPVIGRGVCLLMALLLVFVGYVSSAEGWNEGPSASLAEEMWSPGSVLAQNQGYVVIGWNDLGMHCISPGYKEMAILPPYNNLFVQVIQRGNPPSIVTSGISVEYSIPYNTKVAGKTDFWTYVTQLFGVTLAPGVGLTGNRLSGKLKPAGDHFEATGIPLLPRDDKMNWNPYQLATIKLKGPRGALLKSTQVVLPVSDELNCAKCHAADMDGTVHIIDTGTVEGNILAVHDYYHGPFGVSSTGPSLYESRPVLCANCHASNALGKPGIPGVKSVSEGMHGWHAQFPDAGCYDCHPGAVTQCLRTGIGGMGYLGDTPSCTSCHGDMNQISTSIAQGRQPWLEEPTCQQCHGINYTTGSNLYRNSRGHGGVYCSACHNSPHAWSPSKLWADNMQVTKLQRTPYSLGKCSVCHTKPQKGDNPHVVYYSSHKQGVKPVSFGAK
jgi:hypothetical protein